MKEIVKLLENYIDYIQENTTGENIINKTDEVILKLMKLKRKYAVDL